MKIQNINFRFFYILYTLKAPLSQKTQKSVFDDTPPLRVRRLIKDYNHSWEFFPEVSVENVQALFSFGGLNF